MTKTKRRTWTPAQKAKVLAYAEKRGVVAASEHYDVTESSIYTWKSKAKAATPKKRKSAPKAKSSNGALGHRAVALLFTSGWSIRDMAKSLKTTPNQVEDILRSTL